MRAVIHEDTILDTYRHDVLSAHHREQDQLAFARGVFNAALFSLLFWAALILFLVL